MIHSNTSGFRALAVTALLGMAGLSAGCGERAVSEKTQSPSKARTRPSATGPATRGTWDFSEEQWRQRLTAKEFRILRRRGTERAGSGALLDEKREGVFRCAGCGLALFDSSDKYDSRTGWPSFTAPIAEGRVRKKLDTRGGMRRTEVLCARCDGHLGHVFSDGPPPTGKRYCINSVALDFEAAGTKAQRHKGTKGEGAEEP